MFQCCAFYVPKAVDCLLFVADGVFMHIFAPQVSVSKVQPLDFVAESRLFIDYIRKMEAGQPIMQAPEAGAVNAGS